MNAVVEYQGQIVFGRIRRRFLFMRRVELQTKSGGYFLTWVPRWKIAESSNG